MWINDQFFSHSITLGDVHFIQYMLTHHSATASAAALAECALSECSCLVIVMNELI